MNIQPKKSLGQNFLKDQQIVQKIVKAAKLTTDDFVMEIGPGEGVLTEQLAKHAGKVVAIEIDRNLIPGLKTKFNDIQDVEIINDDVLKINLPELAKSYKLKAESYKVVANIPYYITSQIVRLFLETVIPPHEMILMVQKEVAERIAAKAGEMSILAVSVQYYAEAEILFTVPRQAFFPVPEVDSAVIRITKINNQETINKEEIKKFFRIVKAGFCARRKTLSNNLANSLHVPKKEVEEKLASLDIKFNARAQELSVEDWKKLKDVF